MIEKELEDAIKTAIITENVELYDIVATKENKQNILRVFISSKDGISIDKCASVSRLISPILDIYEPMNDKYLLEVSSPGVERKLKTLHHFKNSIGDMVKIKEFSTEVFKGKLLSVDDSLITIKLENSNEKVEINFDDILAASTYFVWK
jgi:ribosome maturation factor RimP